MPGEDVGDAQRSTDKKAIEWTNRHGGRKCANLAGDGAEAGRN